MRIMNVDVPLPESPTAKFLTWVFVIAGGTVTLTFAAIHEFMPRVEAEAMKIEYTTQIAAANTANTKQFEQTNLNVEYVADSNRKWAIDNELFKLEQIPESKTLPAERALKTKLIRERAELVNVWTQRGRSLK